ncbi:unnamed protein product [Sphagnum tenellum]
MQRAAFRAALAEALKGRILATDGVEPQLHMVYLANDSLFNRSTAEKQPQGPGSGGSCLQQPVLGSMLAAIYDNPQNAEVNWDQLQKTLHSWGAKEVFEHWHDQYAEGEMVAGPPPPEPPSLKQRCAAGNAASALTLFSFQVKQDDLIFNNQTRVQNCISQICWNVLG